MFARTTFLATLLAIAGAHAAADPMVTPPPTLKHRRDIFDDARDLFNTVSSAVDGAVDDARAGVECIDRVEDVFDDHERPDPDDDALESAVSRHFLSAGDLCAASAVPASLQADWSAYEASLVSWYSTASAALQSAADACPSLDADVQRTLVRPPCSTALQAAQVTAVVFDGPTATGASASTGTDAGGAAPRATGLAVGAAAFAVGAAAVML